MKVSESNSVCISWMNKLLQQKALGKWPTNTVDSFSPKLVYPAIKLPTKVHVFSLSCWSATKLRNHRSTYQTVKKFIQVCVNKTIFCSCFVAMESCEQSLIFRFLSGQNVVHVRITSQINCCPWEVWSGWGRNLDIKGSVVKEKKSKVSTLHLHYFASINCIILAFHDRNLAPILPSKNTECLLANICHF